MESRESGPIRARAWRHTGCTCAREMTSRQVRAAVRRLKERNEDAGGTTDEINLVPYMDIVTNIIIFLLAVSATQVPLGNVDVSLPGSGPCVDCARPAGLDLAVTLAASGILVGTAGAIEDPIPRRTDGAHDFARLSERLSAIKARFPTETRAILNADASVPFDVVVRALDAIREDAGGRSLFPDIGLAVGVETWRGNGP